jgi:hypothetical protein
MMGGHKKVVKSTNLATPHETRNLYGKSIQKLMNLIEKPGNFLRKPQECNKKTKQYPIKLKELENNSSVS